MKAFAKALYLFSVMFVLAACGGGGSVSRDETPTTPTDPTDPVLSISLTIVNRDDVVDKDLSATNPLSVVATVTDESGNAVDGELITFTLSPENLAEFTNDSGTSLTNDDGVATIGLTVGQDSGSGLVVAALESGVTAQIGYNSAGTITVVEQPSSLELFASQGQLSSSGSDQVELLAVVKNAQNVLLQGITVSFSADADASITETQPVTDENGIARVNLNTINHPENRTITVTAIISSTSVDLTKTLAIEVIGTEININGPNSVIIGDTVDLTINLEDSDNRGISGRTLSVVVTDAQGNDVTNSTLNTGAPITSSEGRANIAFNAPASGLYTIVASALNAQASFEMQVQQDQFSFVNPPDVNDVNDDIPLNQDQELTIQWLRESNPFAGGNVSFSISRGQITSAEPTTDANGEATLTVQSDNAGIATLTATGEDGQGNTVGTQVDIAFIATIASDIILDATPDAIGPDGQTSTISALVRDAEGNRVRNKRINFSVNDVSNGNLTEAFSSTDRRGIATTVYESNAVSTIESVEVRAWVDDDETVESFTYLTVGDRPFDISLGTGNLISAPQASSYQKEFSAFVTDPDSNPVADAELTFSAPPVPESEGYAYFKGYWLWDAAASIYVRVVTAACYSEDVNGNGILDAGEDTNGDGELTPGNVGVMGADATTGENGQALVYLDYARQFGGWVQLKVKARGESAGNQSSESMFYLLSVATEDRQTNGAPPPDSKWGVGQSCTDTL